MPGQITLTNEESEEIGQILSFEVARYNAEMLISIPGEDGPSFWDVTMKWVKDNGRFEGDCICREGEEWNATIAGNFKPSEDGYQFFGWWTEDKYEDEDAIEPDIYDVVADLIRG